MFGHFTTLCMKGLKCKFWGAAQPEHNVPRTSTYGRDVSDHIRTKTGCIKFLTFLALQCLIYTWHQEIQKNFLKNLFYGQWLNWRPEDVPRASHRGCHFMKFLGRSQDVSPKLKEYALTNLLVFDTHIWWIKTKNITTKISFVLMFKNGALGTSWERHPLGVYKSLGRFSKKCKTIKQITI